MTDVRGATDQEHEVSLLRSHIDPLEELLTEGNVRQDMAQVLADINNAISLFGEELRDVVLRPKIQALYKLLPHGYDQKRRVRGLLIWLSRLPPYRKIIRTVSTLKSVTTDLHFDTLQRTRVWPFAKCIEPAHVVGWCMIEKYKLREPAQETIEP